MEEKMSFLRLSWNFCNVFVIKFIIGLVDVITDLVSGHNLISGQFLLSIYFASKTREEYLLNKRNYTPWGILTIFFVWFPGLLRILTIGLDQTWKGVSATNLLKRVLGFMILLAVWPFFSLLM